MGELSIRHCGWARYCVERDGVRLNETWLIGREAAEKFVEDEMNRIARMEAVPTKAGDGHVLVACRTLRTGGVIYPPGSAVPAETWPNLRALLDQHALAWMPASRVTSTPREADAGPVQDEERKPVSPAQLDALVAKHDRGGDPVASWRALIADLAKRLGSPAAARDRLALHPAGSRLEQRAQRVYAESEAKRRHLGASRPVDGLYSGA